MCVCVFIVLCIYMYKVKYLNSRYKKKKNSQTLEVNERENCTRTLEMCSGTKAICI